MSVVGQLLRLTLSQCVPQRCVSCGHVGSAFCQSCQGKITAPASPPLCWRCGRSLRLEPPVELSAHPPLCPGCAGTDCWNSADAVPLLRAIAWHEGSARAAVHALKYQGRRQVASPLGDMLARYLQNQPLWKIDVVIPVPLAPKRQRMRRFNQADLIAKRCAKTMHVLYLPRALARRRSTRPQVGLSREERRENVQGAFILGPQGTAQYLGGACVAVIDDVITTGSTLRAAAAALWPLGPSLMIGMAVTRPAARWLPATHTLWLGNQAP